ncbi:MAG: zinc-finger domain-containing protein [Alphaproteobacteria bacterium]|nr:zinc-finger domain-containing protein [Alphaproteobacteria bacterium]
MSGDFSVALPSHITAQPEIIMVDRDVNSVKCNGGNLAMGHPVVYYSFDGRDQVKCLYCDRIFIKDMR